MGILVEEGKAKTEVGLAELALELAPATLKQWQKSNHLFCHPAIITEDSIVKKIKRM